MTLRRGVRVDSERGAGRRASWHVHIGRSAAAIRGIFGAAHACNEPLCVGSNGEEQEQAASEVPVPTSVSLHQRPCVLQANMATIIACGNLPLLGQQAVPLSSC